MLRINQQSQNLPLFNPPPLVPKDLKDRPAKDPEKSQNQRLRKILNLLKVERKIRRERESLDLDLPALKPNTSAYGDTSDRGGKRPKLSVKGQTVESGSDVDASHPVQQVDYEGHSDSLTDS